MEKNMKKDCMYVYIYIYIYIYIYVKKLPGTDAESCLCFISHKAKILTCEMHFK